MVGGQLAVRVVRRRAWLIAATACLAAAFVLAAASGARAAVPGAFTTLASSSEPLTAVTTDPTTGIVYAQGNQTQDFFKYNPATDTWSPLAQAPIEAQNDGGAAYLDGKIYVAYPDDNSDLGVYNVATNAWSTIPNPIGLGTGDITAVGGLLYLGVDNTFVSYEPVSKTTTPLANAPGFTGTSNCDGDGLSSWGAVVPFEGKIYATQGNGCNGFAVYDIASDTWTQGPNVPDGATLGGAIDPTSGTFFAYGNYEGNSEGSDHFYAYDISTNKWSTPPNVFPFNLLDDGGLTYVSTPAFQGIYAVFGEEDNGFVRFTDVQDASVSEGTPSPTTAGSLTLLSLTVTNNGSAETPISFTDSVPAGLSIATAVAGNGACSTSGQQVTCTLSGLRPTQSSAVSLIVTPASAGTFTNHASVAVAAGFVDPVGSNNSAAATLQAASAAVATPPVKCMVPSLKGTPVGVARHVLSLLHCKAGKVTKAHSKSIRKGNVIKTSPKAGSYTANRTIGLQVSSGPKAHHKKKAKKGHHHT